MANTNSSIISGVADPASMANVGISGGRMRVAADTFEIAANPTAEDTLTLCRLPSGARIYSIKLFCDDMDTGGTELAIDLGLVETDGTGGDPDCLVDGATDLLTAAQTGGIEVRFDHTTFGVESINKQVFELAGKTADDGKQMDLLLTFKVDANTFPGGGASLSFLVTYVID